MKISITEPCHENWDAMTPNQQGAFCHSCAKDVVDFSKKSLEEIKNFFSKPQSGRVCGRFEEKQLQELSVEDFVARFTYWNFSKKFAAIFFMAFGLLMFAGNEAEAQYTSRYMMKGEVAVVEDKAVKKNTGNDEQHQEAERRMIKGKVARQVCTTVDPVTTVKGNAKVETIPEVKEEQMIMGMIAFNPPKKEEPKKDTTVKGDTVVTRTITESQPITGEDKNIEIKETENLKHTIYENGEVDSSNGEPDVTKTKEPEITVVIDKIVMGQTTVTETNTNNVPDNTIDVTETKTITTETEVPVAENIKSKSEEPILVNNETKILLYPNPSNGKFVIEVPAKQSVTVLDENGRIVLTQDIEGIANIDASHLRAGTYYVNFVSEKGHEIKKITITK
ncbi:MAG: T9SS type A sorting domain-containing protein [Bacteroidia bacterium]